MEPVSKNSITFLLRLIFLTWIISKAICFPLWMGYREFPLVPVWDGFSVIPAWVHFALFVTSMALMALSIIVPRKLFIRIILILEILSCLLDQNRWQPWEYQFLFFIFCFAVLKTENMIRKSWQVILVSTYFFGGLFKMNPYFIHDTWQYLILIKWLHIQTENEWLLRAGYIIPIIELIAGLFLLFMKTQRLAAIVLMAMHIFILGLLGPAGLNINGVVWPWNIFLAIMLGYLFLKNPHSVFGGMVHFRPAFIVVIIAWMVMPWFRFAGIWDKYLSSVLYGGGVEQLFICTTSPEALQKSAPYRKDNLRFIPCEYAIPVYKWGMYNMSTAPYPEQRVFKKIMIAWKDKYGSADFYLYKPGFKATISFWNTSNGGNWQQIR